VKPIAWIVGAIVRTILVAMIAVLGVLQIRSCSPMPRDDTRSAEVRAQLAFLRRSMRDENAVARMQKVFPEGACFLSTLYALAWANVGRASNDASVRAAAVEEMKYALDQIDSPTATAPFRDTQVRRGVFWAGQRNIVLGELLELETPERRKAALVSEFHAASQALSDGFVAAPTHHMDSFPGFCWPADQIAALASLRVHDRLFGGDLARASEAWKTWTLAHLDPTTNLPPGQISSANGRLIDPARGCGTSWILALLPRVDPTLSRVFYARYVERLGATRLGFRMFAEWPEGADGGADVDSGPIIWRVGMAATGAGLAAARANGDAARAADIRSLAQTLGFPWTSDGGASKSYLFGQLPVADAFLAYGLSIDLPAGSAQDDRGTLGLLLDRWKFHALVTALQLALVAVLVHGVRHGRRVRRATSRAPSPARQAPPAPTRA
jgi:hypothetical protein